MRVILGRQREFGFQVRLYILWHLHGGVDRLLQCLALLRWANASCLGGTEKRRLTIEPFLFLSLGLPGKGIIIDVLDGSRIDRYFRAGSNTESLIDPTKRNSVHVVWTRHEEKTCFFKLFQTDYTATTESASQQDQYCARSDRSSQLRDLLGFLDMIWINCLLALALRAVLTQTSLAHSCNKWYTRSQQFDLQHKFRPQTPKMSMCPLDYDTLFQPPIESTPHQNKTICPPKTSTSDAYYTALNLSLRKAL